MRIGTYEIVDRPEPGWVVPQRHGRISVDPVLSGVVAQAHPGHPGDEVVTLRWGLLNASPARTLLLSYASYTTFFAISTLERYAWLYTPPTAFEAVSAARLLLRAIAPVAGYLTLEVWSAAGGAPVEKVGVVGHVNVADIDPATYEAVPFWGLSAWPLDSTNGSFLVLSADHMTGAGSIRWAVTPVVGTNYFYTGGAWGGSPGRRPTLFLWQGGPYCVLRGLTGARNLSGSSGSPSYEIDLDDGQLYTGLLLDFDGAPLVFPTPSLATGLANVPCTTGIFRRVSLTLGLTGEL